MKIGIDFGSTYSVISAYNDAEERVEILTLAEDDSASIPSVVSVNRNGKVTCGKGAKEQEFVKHDKGVLSRLQTLFAKMSNGFSDLENKSLNLADKLRYNRIKDSVKADLDFFNGKTTAKDAPTPVKDNVR